MPTSVELGVVDVRETIEQLFELSGEENGDEYAMLCPNPDHPDTSPSCSVNLETGYWNCFSCGSGGDIAQLGVVSMGMPRSEVIALFTPSTVEALITVVQHKLNRLEVHSHMTPKLELPGPYETEPMYELRRRGFTDATLKRWGIQFAIEQELEGHKGKFTIRNSLAIPIRDRNRKLLCWCYRATSSSPDWQAKYMYTPGVDINEIWFGLQHHHSANEITIVEGALDAMWLDQAGIPALGLLGSNMGNRKILELQRYDRVNLFGDLDPSGAKAVQRIGELLGDRVPVFVVRYPSYVEGEDPQDIDPVDLEIMLERAVPWFRYRAASAERTF